MRIDILGLQAFVAIAERGGFHHAALHLGLSPTALSHRMRKLEDEIGIKLLVRTTREVTLTQAGLDLMPGVQNGIASLSQAIDALVKKGDRDNESIAVGCLPTIASAFMPDVLARFRARHPSVVVHLHDHSASAINELLGEGTIAFAVTMVMTQRWDFDVEHLTRDAFCMICPAAHPFAARTRVDWSDLADQALVRVSQQTGNRMLLDDALGSRRESLRWLYEVQHLQTALAIVRRGDALSVIPRMAFDSGDDRGLACVPLRNPTVTRQIGLVTKRGIALSPLAASLRRDVIAVVGDRGDVSRDAKTPGRRVGHAPARRSAATDRR